MPEYFIGLMSGTSIDAIDTVLVNLANHNIKLVDARSHPIPEDVKQKINLTCTQGKQATLNDCACLDADLGNLFAEAAIALLKQNKLSQTDIVAIASHGQTVYHNPDNNPAYTIQLGDANIIAEKTGITTVADFRRRDIAAGGQGAPLVPAFHEAAFRSQTENRVILNIGGIANITILNADTNLPVTGFDTGPGNTLLNQWAAKKRGHEYDQDGQFAAQGKINPFLLDSFLNDSFFDKAAPKSTGRELFNLEWLHSHKAIKILPPEDVQRTLCELSTVSIVRAIQLYAADTKHILVCGGGCHNPIIMDSLRKLSHPIIVDTTEILGVHPDWVEAIAFAWMAQRTLELQSSNLPSVTGAHSKTILGAVYYSNSA